jgi:hypothetical protein
VVLPPSKSVSLASTLPGMLRRAPGVLVPMPTLPPIVLVPATVLLPPTVPSPLTLKLLLACWVVPFLPCRVIGPFILELHTTWW